MGIATFSGESRNSADAIRNAAVILRVLFKNPDGVPVNVLNPVGSILYEGVAQTLDALGTSADPALRYALLADASTGLYKLPFLTTGLKAGFYHVTFEGGWTDTSSVVHTLRVEGDIALGEVSRLQHWIRRVEFALMDDVDPSMYRLDEPIPQWSADQIYAHLVAAIDRINMFPPRQTNYDVDTLPFDQLAIDGARVDALYARARLEKANEFDYSDGHSVNFKRADFYKSLADTLYEHWRTQVIDWKKSTPPTPIGLGSQRLPFRISRVLGLLPNFKTLFSG